MKALLSLCSSRYSAALFSGLLLALSFPSSGLAGLAWVAPGLIGFLAAGQHGAGAFRIGYVAGLAFHLFTLRWILNIPVAVAPVAGWVSLSGYMALYPGAWAWLLWQFHPSPNTGAKTGATLRELVEKVSTVSWSGRALWCLAGAAAWVALEMVASRLMTGFPWNLLGVSQYRMIPLIQVAAVTGVYGVSFLIVWMSLSLGSAALRVLQEPTRRWGWLGEIILPSLVIAAVSAWGWNRVVRAGPDGPVIKAALVQPSIPQTVIWDPAENAQRFADLVRLSESALASHPDLLIWPEAAVPNLLRWHEETHRAATTLARSNQVWMIVGADDAEPRRETPDPDDVSYYNGSFLLDPEGRIVDHYYKRRLVVFGEYVPLARWLPFLKYLTPIDGGFDSGSQAAQFHLPDLGAKTSVLICFEDVFPHLAREHVDSGTDFLLNLTNDGWFSESSAQWQHAANALFRAVENGVPLVRCTNNGLTCWIDRFGRIRQVFSDHTGSIYGSGHMVSYIPLRTQDADRQTTFYNRHGDRFGWSCAGLTVFLCAIRAGRARRQNNFHRGPNPVD